MNYLDFILLVPVAWFGIKGLMRGLAKELTSLIGLICAIYISLHFSNFAANLLSDTFHLSGRFLPIASFIVTFLVVIIVFWITGKALTKLIEAAELGFFNRLLGLIFGVVRAVVLVSLLFFIIRAIDPNKKLVGDEDRNASMFYKYTEKVMDVITPWIDLERFKTI
jgi:membrane protein required for colicin V production